MTKRTDLLAAREREEASQVAKAPTNSRLVVASTSKSAKPAAHKSTNKKKKPPMSKATMAVALTEPSAKDLKEKTNQFMKKVYSGHQPGTRGFYQEAFKHTICVNEGRIWYHHEHPNVDRDHPDSEGPRHMQVQCHVCAILHKNVPLLIGGPRAKDCITGCKSCKKAFHPDCWTIFHKPSLFIDATPPVRKDLITLLYHYLWKGEPFNPRTQDRPGSYSLGCLQNMLLKHEEDAIAKKIYPQKKKKEEEE